ncbi:S9 family peptidase [Nonomuraea jiangxiensis]|uniref:Dipeptidyl aminopeptidase/acylaminoacyl peptidase n=1 Tax=Nonomuraea jiangxiensis TaxID=633440 RepID=A0A1G9C6V4_9ACTN|nr:S9 family peptidase [Nonomuraea jiangxiensis]SDK47095.1 Dipeptidyl aminopeptidase/acylaminoacyl peptidase [Nonomuraea jiangxiensis]
MPHLVLDDFYRLAIPSDPQVRPDGGAVAYTLTTAVRDSDENRTEVWLAEPGAEPRRLAAGSAARWSPDGRTLAFLRPVDGRPQIHLLPMDGGEPTPVTSATLGAGPAVWSPDGTRIAYAALVGTGEDGGAPDQNAPIVATRLDHKADGAGLVNGLTRHLFVTETDTGETFPVTTGDFFAGEPSWSPDGLRLVFAADLDDDRDLEPGGAAYAVDAVKGAVPERLTDPGLLCGGVWWLGDRLVAAAHKGGLIGHVRLFTFGPGGWAEVETGLDRNVMTGAPGYPGGVPALLGTDLLFCARDGGSTHLYRLPEGGARAERLVPGEVNISGISAAAGAVAYVAATQHSAGDVHLLTGGQDPSRLTDHALGDVELFTARRRTFTAPDGTRVEGFVLRDESAQTPGPLLLDVHGGPHNAWSPVFDGFHLYHQLLAARGWTVLTVNPRASDGYGEDFYTAAIGAWGLADAQDLLAPIDALIADGVADPERLAVTGYSYGGYMSCWLSATTDRFKAAIPGGCVSDLASMGGTADLGLLLKEHECRGDLAAQSPITHVANVTAPTLLLHGQDDDRCPVGQAEQWFAALRERRVPVELVRYPGASHLFILGGRPSHRYDYNERIIAWLEQWVSGSPS